MTRRRKRFFLCKRVRASLMYLIKIYKFLERKIGNDTNFNIPIKIIRAKKKLIAILQNIL